jgi:hypothetical protein
VLRLVGASNRELDELSAVFEEVGAELATGEGEGIEGVEVE